MRCSGNFVRRTQMAIAPLCVTNKCSQMKLEVNEDESEDEEERSNRSLLIPIESTLSKLKGKVLLNRCTDVKEKMEKNCMKLLQFTAFLSESAKLWESKSVPQEDKQIFRSQKVLCCPATTESIIDGKDEFVNSAVSFASGNMSGLKSARSTKLASQQNVPPYTTWIYLDRNQRMTEDQSVQGRRRIYYDPVGNETLIASDSEEEEVEDEEPKHEFSKGEDYIIWTAVMEHGSSDLLFERIAEAIHVKCEEVQERYELLLNDVDKQAKCEAHAEGIHSKVPSPSARRKGSRDLGRMSFKDGHNGQHADSYRKINRNSSDWKPDEKVEAKDLVAAMDSFDNLFCRRCLVFDCRLHGCSQPLVHPSERQTSSTDDLEPASPCGAQCYLLISHKTSPNSCVSTVSELKAGNQESSLEEDRRDAKRQKTQEQENHWYGEKRESDKVVEPSTSKDCHMTSNGPLDIPVVIDFNEAVQFRKNQQSSVSSRLTSHKKLARSSSRRALEEKESLPKPQAEVTLIDLTVTDFVARPKMSPTEVPIIDLTETDGESPEEEDRRTTHKFKECQEGGKLDTLDVAMVSTSLQHQICRDERAGITLTKKLARIGKRTFMESTLPCVDMKQDEDPHHMNGEEQVANELTDVRVIPLLQTIVPLVEKKTLNEVTGSVKRLSSGGVSLNMGQSKVDISETRSRGTSPKKLARSAARPSAAKLAVIAEFQSCNAEGDTLAITHEAERPAKEEKTSTAARKLARSARKVFAEKVAVAIQQQQLLTPIDLNRARKEQVRDERFQGVGPRQCNSTTAAAVSPFRGGVLSQSLQMNRDTIVDSLTRGKKESPKDDITTKHIAVLTSSGGGAMDQGHNLISSQAGSLSDGLLAKFDTIFHDVTQRRKGQTIEGKHKGSDSLERIPVSVNVCSPQKAGNFSKGVLTKYDSVHARTEAFLKTRQGLGNCLHEVTDVDVRTNLVNVVQPNAMNGLVEEKPCTSGDDSKGVESFKNWTALEKGLCEKGLQIFGRSSCKIANTMLEGCKTCADVWEYISAQEAAARHGSENGIHQYPDSVACVLKWDVARARARFLGRRKGSRKLKFTLKSAGQSAIRKRMVNGKDAPCRQYTPCGCLFTCGKQCPCQLSGTCCEKYCGCAKNCKNRFRGCHCAKSQCCSRQCPCFAAGRECDPDVCRNCWIGCGEGSSAGPPQRDDKDNYQCHNMKLLLKQQQRVLLARSDVAGWGAFLKNPVNKHEYLGEYTGELITHREADKRGKIYDRENSSFLFNLNDQCVLDACRKGDKLKFANHSPNPNCYAKVIMVAGDHRVGIYAKERILAGEELFYDYRYEAERAPAWARKGEDIGNGKKDDAGPSERRSKHAS